MSCPILNILLLVLEISSDFTLDAIYKGDSLSKALSQKSFKFVLGQRNSIFDPGFVLLPEEKDFIFQKKSRE